MSEAVGALDMPPCSEVMVLPTSDRGAAMPVALLNCIPVLRQCSHPSHSA